MAYSTAMAIIGATGSGKTAVAFEVARRLGVGEVVNLDKVYLFRHFPISSGLADTLKEKEVSRHLYELLEPDQEIIPVAEYAVMVRDTCSSILSKGGLPIIEGASTTYFPGFAELNRKEKFCNPIIGPRPLAGIDFKEKFRQRIDAALQEGLLDEVRQGLHKYRNTLVMSDAHAVVPLVRYMDGIISLDEAKAEIIARSLAYAERQTELFSKYPEIIWIEHDPKQIPTTVEKIISMLA